MKPKVLFVYFVPHPSHRGFAEAIGADFWHYNYYFKNRNLPKIFKSFVNGILLPKYDIYLTEGGAPLTPVAIKKMLSRKSININIIADETFMMMKETPEEMRDKFPWYVNLVHKIVSKYIDGAIAVSKLAKKRAWEKNEYNPLEQHFLSKERTCAKKEYNSFGKAFLLKKRFDVCITKV